MASRRAHTRCAGAASSRACAAPGATFALTSYRHPYPRQPSASAMELIRHEYTLAWIGTNVTFLLGLFGALALVTLR